MWRLTNGTRSSESNLHATDQPVVTVDSCVRISAEQGAAHPLDGLGQSLVDGDELVVEDLRRLGRVEHLMTARWHAGAQHQSRAELLDQCRVVELVVSYVRDTLVDLRYLERPVDELRDRHHAVRRAEPEIPLAGDAALERSQRDAGHIGD